MKTAGYVLISIGLIALVFGLLFDTTVETDGMYSTGRTHNLGLMQTQMLIWQGGIGAFVGGAILASVGSLIERLEASGIIKHVAPEAGDFDPGDHVDISAEDLSRPGGLEMARNYVAQETPDKPD